jgi:arylsulfatase A-like enzyme
MIRRQFILLFVCCLSLGSSAAVRAASSLASKPNIIFFLADDLGYMDLVAYASRVRGNERADCFYETPHIDQLIDGGVMFTQAYAAPLCSPTRSSVITGKYAARLGFMTATPGGYKTHYNQGQNAPNGFYAQDGFESKTDRPFWPLTQGNSNIALPLGETTIAEALTGYNSAFIGKWHLGGHGSAGYSPADQGFEEIAWFDSGGSPYFNWRSMWNNRKKLHPAMAQEFLEQGNAGEATGEDYLTDDLAVQASRFIECQAREAQPFFLYFCQFAVHSPFQAKQEDIQHFAKKETRGWNGQSNPTYAGMIKAVDDCVGTVLETLKSTGQANNTIIVFMSDNGGIVQPDENGVPTISNNAPLKGEKALLYEGGIRVPLFVWYPKALKPGVCDVPVVCNDLYPSVLQMAGQPLDVYQEYGDGHSLVPLLVDPTNSRGDYQRDTFYWHYPYYVSVGLKHGDFTAPRSAIRKGDWKLILDWDGSVELYNICNDISEKSELSAQEPERTAAMFKDLVGWINETVESRYIPKTNSRYDPQHVQARPYGNIFEKQNMNWPTGRTSRVGE